MKIRIAKLEDAEAIKDLLDQLGYLGKEKFIHAKIEKILNQPTSELIVYEEGGKVLAFIAIDFITQLGVEGDLCCISYFAVAGGARSLGIGGILERHCEGLCRARNCNRIELHCNERRTDAHRFYFRQGYVESPKYLVKSLT